MAHCVSGMTAEVESVFKEERKSLTEGNPYYISSAYMYVQMCSIHTLRSRLCTSSAKPSLRTHPGGLVSLRYYQFVYMSNV